VGETVPIAIPLANEVDYRLELTWSSSAARVWAGQVQVSTKDDLGAVQGRLSKTANLTPGMLMSGGIHLTAGGDQIQFAPPPSTKYLQERLGKFVSQQTTKGGLIFHVRGIDSDRVIVSLRRDETNDLTAPIAISLAELANGRSIESRFSDTASWRIKRVDGDRLRVALVIPNDTPEKKSDHQGTSLFWDDQTANIHVQSDRVSADSLELVCETLSGGSRVVASQSWPVRLVAGRCVVSDSPWRPPVGDGSYVLRWQLRHRSDSRSTWTNSIPSALKDSISKPISIIRGTSENPVIAESKSNVVVLSRQRSNATVATYAAVSRIEPFGGSWSVNRFIPVRQATQLASMGVTQAKPKKTELAGKLIAELPPGGHWEHAIPVSKVGERHRLTVTFPDARAMRLGVCVIDRSNAIGKPSVLRDVTIMRTRMRTTDSPWSTASIDFYPQSSAPQLLLVNRDEQQPVSFEAIDVSVSTVAQAQPVGTAVTSSPSPPTGRRALVYLDSRQWLEWFGNLVAKGDTEKPAFGDELVAANRLIESLRQYGYAGVMMTVCDDGSALYPSKFMTADISRNGTAPVRDFDSPETLEMLLRLFDREGLAFMPCVRANFPLTSLEKELIDNSEKSRGISPANPWNGFDLALGEVESMKPCIYNPLHENVAGECRSVVEELLQQTVGHDSADTIGVLADEGSCFRLPSRRATLDNATLDRFFQSLPPGKIVRSQVFAWVNEDGASAFDNWRNERFREMAKQWIEPVFPTNKRLMIATTSDQVSSELLQLAPQSKLSFSQLYRRSPLQSLASRSRNEATNLRCNSQSKSSEGSIVDSAIFLSPESSAKLCNGDKELLRICGRESDEDIHSLPLNDPSMSSLVVARLLSRCDRRLLVVSGYEAFDDSESRRRSILNFQALPPTLLEDVPSSDKAMKLVKLRRLETATHTYFVATNHCRWPMSLEVVLPGVTSIEGVVQNGASTLLESNGAWRASLDTGELAAIRVPRMKSKSLNWSASISGSSTLMSEVGDTIRELAEVVAVNGEPPLLRSIENPSFEADSPPMLTTQAAGMGTTNPSTTLLTNVPGWLLSQHPVGCAVLDEEVALDGKRSIRLSNRDGRPGGTWIVSRAIPTPASERIAMSLMVRGEPSEEPAKSKPIILRVAIEGAVAGSSMRQVISINVPRNGKWSQVPCRVQVDSLPRCGIESLRVAIDVMNEGTVWIDSVKAEDSFLTDQERTQLQSQMFLALGGITNGELSQASRLFESQWVQEMLRKPAATLRPIVVNEAPTLDGDVPNSDNDLVEEEAPGIADRIKAWLPKPVRF